MKKLAVILLAVFLLCVPCITVFAVSPEQKGATISTTVPAVCHITFISDGGRIEEDNKERKGTETFDRSSVHTFHIVPDSGKEIDKVLFGEEDVTSQVRDNHFTTPPLTKDTTFTVMYKETGTTFEPVSEPTKPDTSIPQGSETTNTGDTATASIFVTATVTAVSAIFILILANRRKKRE